MATEPLNKEIKTRVPEAMKNAFEKIADERGLKAADVYREALRDYLATHGMPNGHIEPQLALGLGKGAI